jgi:hypothetical protein
MWLDECKATGYISQLGSGLQNTICSKSGISSQHTKAACTGALVDNNRTTSEISKQSFLVISTKLWNALPQAIRPGRKTENFQNQIEELDSAKCDPVPYVFFISLFYI